MKKKWMMALLAFFIIFSMMPTKSYAESGEIYTVTINRSYRHPVTGVIEDSGGESSLEIGQGMVEGAVHSQGILEVTSSGEQYLTITMSLLDYTSGHSIWVQDGADSQWYAPESGITSNGVDDNGTTGNLTIHIPHEECILKGTMYVEPMGRDVVWFMSIGAKSEGNTTDIPPTYINETEPSGDAEGNAAPETPKAPPLKAADSGKEDEKNPPLKTEAAGKQAQTSVQQSSVTNGEETAPDAVKTDAKEGLTLSTTKNAEEKKAGASKQGDSTQKKESAEASAEESAQKKDGGLPVMKIVLFGGIIALVGVGMYFIGKHSRGSRA